MIYKQSLPIIIATLCVVLNSSFGEKAPCNPNSTWFKYIGLYGDNYQDLMDVDNYVPFPYWQSVANYCRGEGAVCAICARIDPSSDPAYPKPLLTDEFIASEIIYHLEDSTYDSFFILQKEYVQP
jgi:hypothetical protein